MALFERVNLFPDFCWSFQEARLDAMSSMVSLENSAGNFCFVTLGKTFWAASTAADRTLFDNSSVGTSSGTASPKDIVDLRLKGGLDVWFLKDAPVEHDWLYFLGL